MDGTKRKLNDMDGFKRGMTAIFSLKNMYGTIKDNPDEYLAYALGTIAGIYSSVAGKDELWELRKKFWHTEEALGESRNNKL